MENAIACPDHVPSLAGLRALAWIDTRTHHIACWKVNGREPTTEPPEEWTHFELQGKHGREAGGP